MKKRIVCILLAAVMTVMLAACGKSDASGSGNMAASEEASQGTESEGSDQENAGTENDEAEDSVAVNAGSESSTVYFTTDISPAGLMNVYEALGWEPTGKVAAKLSTGEPPASNYLDPALIADLVQSVDATIVECNTAYGGSRTETAMHMQVAEDHGFTAIADVDILDADDSMELPVEGGRQLTSNRVGAHFANYDSYIILSHFKGHAMAGFGGAIKI